MSGSSAIADCCAVCFGLCCVACCESILVSLNIKKPGARPGSTQRGCCRNWGESTEDDVFEEDARRERLAKSSEKHKNRDGGDDGKGAEGNNDGEEGGDKTVDHQPAPSLEMIAPPTDVETKT